MPVYVNGLNCLLVTREHYLMTDWHLSSLNNIFILIALYIVHIFVDLILFSFPHIISLTIWLTTSLE